MSGLVEETGYNSPLCYEVLLLESQAGAKNMGGDFRTESTSHIYVNLILIWLLISDAFVQDDIRNQSQNNQGQWSTQDGIVVYIAGCKANDKDHCTDNYQYHSQVFQ